MPSRPSLSSSRFPLPLRSRLKSSSPWAGRIAAKKKKKPKPKKKRDWYEIGDKVQAFVEGEWFDAEVEAFAKKASPHDYIVFYKAEGKRWESEVKAEWLRPRP